MELAGVAQQHRDPLEDAPGGGGEPGQRGDLADHDEHDQAGHETGDDRLAEELRDPAQAQQAHEREHDPGRDGEHRGELHGELGVAAGQGAHDRPGQHRHRRDRPDEEQPRGAEQRVGEQGRRQRVEADLHRHAGDDGVPEGLGDGQGGDEQPREDVGGQVATGVPAQQTQPVGEARRWEVHGGQSAPSGDSVTGVLGPADGAGGRLGRSGCRMPRCDVGPTRGSCWSPGPTLRSRAAGSLPRGRPEREGLTTMKRTYVVTGAASGIGQATAALLRNRGHRVIGVDVRSVDVVADLSTPEGRQEAIDGILCEAGRRLDAVIANAGPRPAEPGHRGGQLLRRGRAAQRAAAGAGCGTGAAGRGDVVDGDPDAGQPASSSTPAWPETSPWRSRSPPSSRPRAGRRHR